MESHDRYIERLIKANLKTSLTMCKKYLFDEDEALMLQSQVLELIWNKRDKFEGTEKDFKGWLYTVVRNSFINNYRTKKIKGGDPLPIEEEFQHPSEDPKDTIDSKKSIENILYSLTEKFGEDYAKTMLLIGEGYNYEEVAEKTGVPVGTVRSRIHRARLFLEKGIIKEKPVEKSNKYEDIELKGLVLQINELNKKTIFDVKTKIQLRIIKIRKRYKIAA